MFLIQEAGIHWVYSCLLLSKDLQSQWLLLLILLVWNKSKFSSEFQVPHISSPNASNSENHSAFVPCTTTVHLNTQTLLTKLQALWVYARLSTDLLPFFPSKIPFRNFCCIGLSCLYSPVCDSFSVFFMTLTLLTNTRQVFFRAHLDCSCLGFIAESIQAMAPEESKLLRWCTCFIASHQGPSRLCSQPSVLTDGGVCRFSWLWGHSSSLPGSVS